MASYKHPCKYCGKLIERDSNFCLFCAQESPLGPIRCPLCRNSIPDGAKICGTEQSITNKKCIKCGELLR